MKFLKFILKGGAMAALIYWLATRFAWTQVWAAVHQMRAIYLVPVVLLITPGSVVLRSARWRNLVAKGSGIPLRGFVRAYLLGFVANALLPSKLGDLVKARMVVSEEVDFEEACASALADRVLEAAVLILLLLLVVIFGTVPSWAKHLAGVSVLLTAVLILAMAGLFRFRDRVAAAIQPLLRLLPSSMASRGEQSLERLLSGFHSFSDARRLASVFAYSAAVWLLEIAAVCSFFVAFSLPVPYFAAAILVLSALNFGTLLPISVGSIGIYQVLCVLALSVWRVPSDIAFTLGLVMQVVLFVPVYAAGLVTATVTRSAQRDLNTTPAQYAMGKVAAS